MLYEIIDFIKDILAIIGWGILLFIVIILAIIFGIMPFDNSCYKGEKVFEYEDLNGNKGIANNCQYSDAKKYARKGGQGQPICFVGKKVITVKWYEDKTKYMNCYKSIFKN